MKQLWHTIILTFACSALAVDHENAFSGYTLCMPSNVNPESLGIAINRKLGAFGWRVKPTDVLECQIWPSPNTVRVFINSKVSRPKNNKVAVAVHLEAITSEPLPNNKIRWKSVWDWYDVALVDPEDLEQAKQDLALNGIEGLLARYRASNP